MIVFLVQRPDVAQHKKLLIMLLMFFMTTFSNDKMQIKQIGILIAKLRKNFGSDYLFYCALLIVPLLDYWKDATFHKYAITILTDLTP
jgi:hypothetical protein